MFKKIKNKIDNHFIRLANSTLDNKLSTVNKKISDTNAKLDTTREDVSNNLSTINNNLNSVSNNLTNIINDVKRHIDIDVATYIKASIVHPKTFGQFKDCCKGKKVVICGAGPSLSKYKPIEGAIHIALNRSILFDKVHFDFLFVQDFVGIKMITNEILNYKNCIKLFSYPYPDEFFNYDTSRTIPEEFAGKCNALRFYLANYITGGFFNCPFTRDIDMEPIGGHSIAGLSVLQFAMFMNPDELYLVGYDLYGGHFIHKNETSEDIEKDKDFYNKHLWPNNERELTINKFKEFKEFCKIYYPHTKIHSINPVSLKGIFNDIIQ